MGAEVAPKLGKRIIVTGLAGAGKSTLSKALAKKTGLPLIHLDLEFWKPGWTAPSEEEWRAKNREVLAGSEWIADGNYHETLTIRLERADTVIYLDTPWWICSARAVVRGLRAPPGSVMPDGCEDSASRRVAARRAHLPRPPLRRRPRARDHREARTARNASRPPLETRSTRLSRCVVNENPGIPGFCFTRRAGRLRPGVRGR